MDFTIDTGDSADNQQLNETEWVRTLLEGGTLNPNSGVDKSKYSNLLCPNLLVPGAAEAARYTGVQDYNDYFEGTFPEFYDPNSPQGPHAAWPKYPGLMDKAQQAFTAAGLKVPSYVAFGNHDALVQGNAAANAAFEAVATGCLKPIGPVPNPENAPALLTSLLNPTDLLGTLLTNPKNLIIVPGIRSGSRSPRSSTRKSSRKARRPTATASTTSNRRRKRPRKAPPATTRGAPIPGMRFIALDTVAEAGTIVTPTGHFTADGNIDDPQFKWLEGQLKQATEADELVVIFSHHAPESLTADAPDELAPPCLLNDAHGHDINPGCDLDPRNSTADPPRGRHGRNAASVPERDRLGRGPLARQHGRCLPQPEWAAAASGASASPPRPTGHSRAACSQVFDNHDGTLSIFGTILDHVGQSVAPPAGTAASGMDLNDLASVGRTMSFNDLQTGAPEGEGEAKDRNVELLVDGPALMRVRAPLVTLKRH